MTPTETLQHEHEIILMVLGAAEREATSIQVTGAVHMDKVEQMLDFFPNFADRCHHAKEEKLLFVKIEERGVPVQGGPIAVMLHEHDQGRALLKATREALSRASDAAGVAGVKDNLSAYVRLLRAHIYKEDNILFPMAGQLFSADDQRALGEAFDKVEAEEIGEGVHDKYHQMAHELAEA